MANISVQPRTAIGKRLEDRRSELGISRDAVKETFGVSKPTYLGLLRYVPEAISARTVENLAKSLDVERIQIHIWLEEDRAKGVSHSSFSQLELDLTTDEPVFDLVEFAESYADTRDLFQGEAAA